MPTLSDEVDEVYIDVIFTFYTTCRSPIHVSLHCISESCFNGFQSVDLVEDYSVGEDQAESFRDLQIGIRMSYGQYSLRADNVTHIFEVKKKLEFRELPEFDQQIEHGHLTILGCKCKLGRGTYWDVPNSMQVFDFLPWRLDVGSFSRFEDNVTFLLSYKGGLHRTDFVTHVSFKRLYTIFLLNNLYKFQFGFDFLLAMAAPELYPMDYPRDFSGRRHVKIGNDVSIGEGALIINSVTIGDGAVIGAYAVVREDVPPYAIVIGNPAKVIRYRFKETQIRMLLEIKWWDWPDEEILFRMPRRDDFEALEEYYQTRSLLIANGTISPKREHSNVASLQDFNFSLFFEAMRKFQFNLTEYID